MVFPDFDLNGRTSDNVVYFDNITFSQKVVTTPEPTVPAPTPTAAATDVISLFSNAYTNVTVDTWSAVWDVAELTDMQVAGDDVKKYSNLVYAGIEFTSAPIDVTAMTHFHMDIWTPDPTDEPASFRVKLVDFGADGAYGGGDDVESELAFTAASTPALASETWVSLDIPLADFTGLTTREHLAQMVLSSDPNTVYIDNVYFHKGTSTAVGNPPAAASAPVLEPNYPNPFNPSTSIRFLLPEAGRATLTVFDALGRPVAVVADGEFEAGAHQVDFRAAGLPSGSYTYMLSAGGRTVARRMMLLK